MHMNYQLKGVSKLRREGSGNSLDLLSMLELHKEGMEVEGEFKLIQRHL